MTTPVIKSWRTFQEDGSYALPYDGWCDALILAAGVAKDYTIPTPSGFHVKKLQLAVTKGADIEIKGASGAALTVADVLDGTANKCGMPIIQIGSETVLSFISDKDCKVFIRPFLA